MPAAKLDETVDALATELASLAPNTMQLGLKAFREQDNMGFDEALPYLKQQLLTVAAVLTLKKGLVPFSKSVRRVGPNPFSELGHLWMQGN